jgi:hypothetical protein
MVCLHPHAQSAEGLARTREVEVRSSASFGRKNRNRSRFGYFSGRNHFQAACSSLLIAAAIGGLIPHYFGAARRILQQGRHRSVSAISPDFGLHRPAAAHPLGLVRTNIGMKKSPSSWS